MKGEGTRSRQEAVWAVVPTKNGLEHLQDSLRSLLATKHDNFHVVVVDDRSSEPIADFLKRHFPSVHYIRTRRKPGFAGSVNAGIEYARSHGAFAVAVANNDIWVHPEWLMRALQLLRRDSIVGFRELPMPKSPSTQTLDLGALATPSRVEGVAGCLYLCPARIFETVGLFDEDYFMYGEDNDFFFRLRRAGVALLDSGFPVWHAGEGSSHSAKFNIVWLCYRNALRFALKNETILGILRMEASMLNQGCNPFLTGSRKTPNRMRLRRYAPPVNLALWLGAWAWNLAHLPWTLCRRFSGPETLMPRPGRESEPDLVRRAPDILMVTPYYMPGFKDGGPIRSLASTVRQLSSRFNFRVLTRDRERGDLEAYPGVRTGEWTLTEGVPAFYAPAGLRVCAAVARIVARDDYDAIYLNSVFSVAFSVLPLALRAVGLASGRPVVLSPRGELAVQALASKSVKKSIFLGMAKMLRLYSGVTWMAASADEEVDIRRVFGAGAAIEIARDLVTPLGPIESVSVRRRADEPLRIVYLARIAPIKNLRFALESLAAVRGRVAFDIYGPQEDRGYWGSCAVALADLPKNVEAHYRGPAEPSEVPDILSHYDLYFLPSESESFGHGIYEALSAGCPVLIGDRTPWKHLEECGCGWAIPLSRPDLFVAAIEKCCEMSHERWVSMRRAAVARASEIANDTAPRDKTAAIFASVAQRSGGSPR